MGEMHDQSDAQLLCAYAEHGTEAAFAEIVARHTDLVYSAALRQVYSPDLARDVTQSVFTDLARKAREVSFKISPEASLVGWLYRGTRFAARDLYRNETRRTQRERQAMEQVHPTHETPPDWEQLHPVLDDAMAELDDPDRDALLLRYFKNHDLRTVGAALGISDDAAQKRVSRAVEKLRGFFTTRGVAFPTAALTAAISVNSVHAAPAALAKSVTAVAVAKGAAASSSTLTLIKTASKLMAWGKAKTAIVTTVILAGVTTTALLIHQQAKPYNRASWDKDSFVYAGYETPQASLRTTLWAMSNGDMNAFLASCAPEEKAERENEWRGKSKEVLAAEGKRQLNGVTGVKILDQTAVSSDRIVLTIYLDGQDNSQKLVFRKIGADWKRTR
jgi:RNA polymerase sigma factor (sigma-70 family)